MSCDRIFKKIWPGTDNAIRLQLADQAPDGTITPGDLSTVTAMRLELGEDYVIDGSLGDGDSPMNWWDSALNTGEVFMKLGPWAETNSVPGGRYVVRLTTWDVLRPNGFVWTTFDGRELTLQVQA